MPLSAWAEIARWSVVASSLVFIFVLVWMFRKWIVPAIEAAQRAKNEELAIAQRHLSEARARIDELQRELQRADGDATAIRRRGEEQGQLERQALVADAREGGERSIRNAQGELDRARASARVAFRDQLLDRALSIAASRATERVDANVNAQLVDAFMSTLERRGAN